MLTRLTRLPCSVTRLGGARGGARVLRASVDTHRRCVGTLPSFAAQGEGQKTPQTMHLTVDDIMAQAADTQRSMRESQAALQAAAAKANKQSAQAGSQVSETDELPGAAQKGVRRFYTNVSVRGVDAAGREVSDDEAAFFEVLIDGAAMKTNSHNRLQLPSQGLAMAIAAEFAVQTDVILPASTPLYNLASTAIDRFPEEEEALSSRLVDFLETDSVCFRVTDEGDDVRDTLCLKRQNKHYNPLIEWFEERFGGPLDVVDGLAIPEHPRHVLDRVRNTVMQGDYYFMSALSSTLAITKSTVISLALLYRHINIDQAFEACRVEEEHQIEHHGFVYDGHDTSRAQARVQLAAISSFLWLLPASQPAELGKLLEDEQ